ncbi:MAG: hypothetical protein WAV89_02595 [Ignavibacteriaceae bacterium]
MRKLITLSFFFAFLGLLFVGCQSAEDLTSPTADLEKPASVYTFNCNPTKIMDETVDLVAGQHNPVGTATFHLNGGNLEISYNLSADEIANGANITEVHIDFAAALNNDSNQGGFHANKSGNPQPGQFDVNTSLGAGQTSWSTTIMKADLVKYLNLPDGSDVPADFYIAAHGVVTWGGEGACPTLPDGKYRYLASVPGTNYYVEGAKLFEDAAGTTLLYDNLNGWCVDKENGAKPGHYVLVNFLCSTSDISGLCLVDNPENIGAVNWLINNKNYGGISKMKDVQVTIWKLLDNSLKSVGAYDTARVDYLYSEAIKHLDFVPGCGEVIGVFMYEAGKDYCSQSAMQVFLIERPVACGGSDTMWGFDWDFDNETALDNYSCRFVEQGNWARYFQF